MKIQIMGGKVRLRHKRQYIARHCQQTFCIQKFVDNTKQYFAFTEGSSYSNVDNRIKSAPPFLNFTPDLIHKDRIEL